MIVHIATACGKDSPAAALCWLVLSLAGGHQVRRQLRRKLVTVQLHVDEVHRQGKLVSVHHAVLVNVRQLPDLAQYGVGKLRLDHLRLGR